MKDLLDFSPDSVKVWWVRSPNLLSEFWIWPTELHPPSGIRVAAHPKKYPNGYDLHVWSPAPEAFCRATPSVRDVVRSCSII